MDFNPASSITRVMVNFRVSGKEKAELDQLAQRLSGAKRSHLYKTRAWGVSTSDILRWGLEALRRELDAAQAAADAAEYNAKHPPKPAKATSPATPKKRKAK